MVQSLKEIVNCPESEIYVALKDCNMDPNEAVNRLLSQDPFHEVKSKREKKKENKDTTESRPRGASSTSTRGARTGSYGGRGGSTQFSSTGDYGNLHGKPAQKKENGTNPYTNYSYPASSAVTGSTTSWQPPASESYTSENKLPAMPVADVIQSAPYQSAWAGVPPGQISMADIVKKGRPQSKAPPSTHHHLHAPSHTGSNSEWPSEEYTSQVDDWPTMPAPPISVSSVINTRSDSELHSDSSNLPAADSINYNQQQQQQSELQQNYDDADLQQNYDDADEPEDEDEEDEDDGEIEDHNNIPNRNIQEEISGAGSSIYEIDVYKNMGSYQPQNDVYEQEAEDVGASVSSAAGNLQELSILDEEARESEDEGAGAPSLVIPNHLQVESADCSHLSFGSFGSAAPFSTSRQPAVRASNIEEQPAVPDSSSVAHLDNRNAEYYAEDSLRIQSEGNMVHRTGGPNAGNYDSPPAPSQPEMLKQENSDLAQQHRNQYMFQSSTSGGGAGGVYAFENSQDLNASLNNSQMQNLAPFSDQQAYTEAVANAMLASANSNLDIPYSPFPVSQSMSTKYGTSVSSISGSTISVAEALKTAGYSSTQQPTQQQTLAGTNVATGPALPQHLVNPYSQQSIPLPFTNMISYPYMQPSYTYMPSGFQQAFAAAGNNSYHQSLAAAGVLPQYKNSVSVSSLPQSAAVPSGYGAFGSSTTIPTNYPMNPPAGPAGATMSYEDLLSSQYKDTNHLISLQQGENPAMWLHGGPGSRTMSALQANHPYYSYQGQSHQQPPAGFRQAQQQQQQQQQQQPSQNYGGGALGYPNFYHSQSGVPLEHHQQQQQQQQAQNPRDGSHSGQPKPSQQIWQNSY
jgi:hypothetical protein